MLNDFGITALIPGLANEVALEIFHHFVAIDRDGLSTLALVCTAWRNIALSRMSLQRFRRDRRRPIPAPMENWENAEEGICIVSFDGGGPGSISQLRMLEEFMARLAFKKKTELDETLPAGYFDLMGGVGFGGLLALLLGRLRMTTIQAMEEVAAIGAKTFRKGDEMITPEVTMARLRSAIESMLVHHGYSADMKLRDNSGNRCKVVIFAATTAVMDHCHPFRTHQSPRRHNEYTFVDSACAAMAIPEYFPSVAIGPQLRKRSFVGIPHGFDNPMREVLKEAQLVFGEKHPISLVLSLGAGQRARLSDVDHHITRRCRIHCDVVARDLQGQLRGFGEYLRLNVDKGMEKIELDDWHDLGSIETHTEVYLEMHQIMGYIDRVVQLLLQRNGSVTLGQLCGTGSDHGVKFASEALKDYLAMQFKEMHDVVQRCGIANITLVDAIGNDIPIPMQFCVTYSMLSDVISLYFKHQRAPGSDFVERGDYRLVHGNRRNVLGATEWTGIEKVGLKVEMSIILRTRNEEKDRCPRCRTRFEGRSTDGWAQCLSCSGHFEIETQVQLDTNDRVKDAAQSDDDPAVEPNVVISATKESKSSEPPMRKRTAGGEATELQFRLISVFNLLEIKASQSPELPDNAGAGCATVDDLRPAMDGRLFTAHGSIAGVDCEVHPAARLLYDSLPQIYRDVFNSCRVYPEKHLDFVRYLHHFSLNDIDTKNEPSSESELIKCLGIPVPTKEGDKKKWRCSFIGCEYKGTLQHIISHLRTKSHLGVATFACTLDCKSLFHHPQDRDRHVKEGRCLKSRRVEDPHEPQGSTRLLRGVQGQFAAVPKPKVKSRVSQQLARGSEYQIPAQTFAQGMNDPWTRKDILYDLRFQSPGNRGHFDPGISPIYFAPPQLSGTPLHQTRAQSNVPTAQDGRESAAHPRMTADISRTTPILPMNSGGMHANLIPNSHHMYNNFQLTSNPQFARASQPVKPEFNYPTGLTYGHPGLDIRGQDQGWSSASKVGNSAGKLYGDDAPQGSHGILQDSLRPSPYVGASNRPEAWEVTDIKEEEIREEEEEETRVGSEDAVAAMDVTP